MEVIQSFFLWRAIFNKDYADAHSYDLLIKSVKTLFNRAKILSADSLIRAFAENGFLFMRFFFDVTFCVGTRKKYGLYLKKNK